MSRPLILLSPNRLPPSDRPLYKGKALSYAEEGLALALDAAGGQPLLAFAPQDQALETWAEHLLSRVDALVLTGGQDIDPAMYGEEALKPEWAGDAVRDAAELALYRAALASQKPVLGVCRGAQFIGVAEGGALWQDLPSLRGAVTPTLEHRCQERYHTLTHPLVLTASSLLSEVFEGAPLVVNSVHHQAIREDRLAPSLQVLAQAPDGVIEAVARRDAWVLGVQWHPEWISEHPASSRLLQAFIARARGQEVALCDA